ncbi:MAG TPA: sigma-E processing peptidase SpoIIGA [Firmicutes bacterium]|nr:sigma-E processing peptidase SpoIIGA [Bacillota bacterium]
MIVYADIVFIVNFVMDFLILMATGRTAVAETAPSRLAMGSLFGSACSILSLLASNSALDSWWVKLAAGGCMVFLSFRPVSLKLWAKLCAHFLAYSFLVAGSAFALSAIFIPPADSFRWWLLPAGGMLALMVSQVARSVTQQRWPVSPIDTLIRLDGKCLRCKGLVDTGNHFIDPLTGKPVVVMEYSTLKPLLPEAVARHLEGNKPDVFAAIQAAGSVGWKTRFRLLPFTSVGSRGTMLAVKLDELVFTGIGGTKARKGLLAAVSWQNLSPDGSYSLLIQPKLL